MLGEVGSYNLKSERSDAYQICPQGTALVFLQGSKIAQAVPGLTLHSWLLFFSLLSWLRPDGSATCLKEMLPLGAGLKGLLLPKECLLRRGG